MTKKQEIINDIDLLMDYLKEVQDAIKDGKDLERIDALDTMDFLSVASASLREKVKRAFRLKDAA